MVKGFDFCSDGQNLLRIFMALVAEGVNLLMKANIFILVVIDFCLSDRC